MNQNDEKFEFTVSDDQNTVIMNGCQYNAVDCEFGSCSGCDFKCKVLSHFNIICRNLPCTAESRKDGRSKIFVKNSLL